MNHQARMQVVMFIAVLMSTMVACKLFQTENQKTTQQGFYAIDPETLLNTLANDETNAFLPITEHDVDRSTPPSGSSINWTQADYFYIVDEFYRLVLHDTLGDWQLNSMNYSLSCAEVDIGSQNGRFEFFKIVKNENDQEVLISRFIDVDPRYRVVLLWEREFVPYVITRSSIELTNIKFASADALQIAEDNGGQNLRLSLNNGCDITLSLSPDSAEYRGWKVLYSRRGSGKVAFDLNIDPFTGGIR
jgi:hypothetical protein